MRVVGCNRNDHNFTQVWVLLDQPFLILEDLLGGFDAVHTGHVDVSQNDAVAYVAAGLGHVGDVHFELLFAVLRLVTNQPISVIQDSLERDHVEDNVVSNKDSCLTAALIFTGIRVRVGVIS